MLDVTGPSTVDNMLFHWTALLCLDLMLRNEYELQSLPISVAFVGGPDDPARYTMQPTPARYNQHPIPTNPVE